MENRRPDRVAAAIREEVANFLAVGVKDPRVVGLVTVTAVEATHNLKHVKIFVSVLGSPAEQASTFEGLASLAPHLRSRVARALSLRKAPDLHFVRDQSVAHAARISSLLASITIPPSDDPAGEQ